MLEMDLLELGYSDERFKVTVNEDLHCPICMNVLKDPVHCGANEHYFCRNCISRHLKNSSNCPSCMQALSLETLKPPSRFVTNRLCKLIIRCDNFGRGCEKFVELGELGAHVKTCGFSPVECPNNGCRLILNKRTIEHHVTKDCSYREKKCLDCDEMRKELEEVKTSLEVMREQLNTVFQLKDALNEAKCVIAQSDSLHCLRQDVIIMGGCETHNVPLNCVEIFKWSKKQWESLKPMKTARVKASSFVYKNKTIITGGLTPGSSQCTQVGDSGSMEMTNLADDSLQWRDFPVVLPMKKSAHKCLVYQDRLLVIGGYDDKKGKYADAIHEVRLEPPYSSKLVARMPCRRRYHGAERFGDKVVILGGTTTGLYDNCLASVLEYDIKTNKFRELPKLPFPVTGMATARWREKVVLIGGVDPHGQRLDSVVVYDVNTGMTTLLPPLKHKREGCSAVITGNVIIVMGGFNAKEGRLLSVECFSFSSYSWEELPPMKKPRSYATVVVKPNA